MYERRIAGCVEVPLLVDPGVPEDLSAGERPLGDHLQREVYARRDADDDGGKLEAGEDGNRCDPGPGHESARVPGEDLRRIPVELQEAHITAHEYDADDRGCEAALDPREQGQRPYGEDRGARLQPVEARQHVGEVGGDRDREVYHRGRKDVTHRQRSYQGYLDVVRPPQDVHQGDGGSGDEERLVPLLHVGEVVRHPYQARARHRRYPGHERDRAVVQYQYHHRADQKCDEHGEAAHLSGHRPSWLVDVVPRYVHLDELDREVARHRVGEQPAEDADAGQYQWVHRTSPGKALCM